MPGGVELRVRVQPRARRAAIGGLSPDRTALRLSVTEPPEDGRANEGVRRAVAAALGVAASSVQLIQGAGARQKTLRIAGDPDRLAERIAALVALE